MLKKSSLTVWNYQRRKSDLQDSKPEQTKTNDHNVSAKERKFKNFVTSENSIVAELSLKSGPTVLGLFAHRATHFYSRSYASAYKFWLTGGLLSVLWLIPCLFRGTGIEPAVLDL
jgi:hypothetical protein